MSRASIQQIAAAGVTYMTPAAAESLTALPLGEDDRAEVLAFLAERPLYNVAMSGYIRDHGVVSPLHRGAFYGCRDAAGRLEGVALVGHATMFDARSEAAVQSVARLAQRHCDIHVVFGEQQLIERFWYHYEDGGQRPRGVCRELLLVQRWPVAVGEAVPELRPATPEDLPLVVPAQAEMALAESGVNPLEADPEGFRRRVARRIEQGRVAVWVRDGRLIFKADVMGETPEAIYLEGVYVGAQERGKGYGRRCLTQLGRTLLARAKAICLLVNQDNPAAVRFYRKAGYRQHGCYTTIFLRPGRG